ncbi:MAG: hypothetical protein AAGM67_21340, partial [Bacteroidota bacterium]
PLGRKSLLVLNEVKETKKQRGSRGGGKEVESGREEEEEGTLRFPLYKTRTSNVLGDEESSEGVVIVSPVRTFDDGILLYLRLLQQLVSDREEEGEGKDDITLRYYDGVQAMEMPLVPFTKSGIASYSWEKIRQSENVLWSEVFGLMAGWLKWLVDSLP